MVLKFNLERFWNYYKENGKYPESIASECILLEELTKVMNTIPKYDPNLAKSVTSAANRFCYEKEHIWNATSAMTINYERKYGDLWLQVSFLVLTLERLFKSNLWKYTDLDVGELNKLINKFKIKFQKNDKAKEVFERLMELLDRDDIIIKKHKWEIES